MSSTVEYPVPGQTYRFYFINGGFIKGKYWYRMQVGDEYYYFIKVKGPKGKGFAAAYNENSIRKITN